MNSAEETTKLPFPFTAWKAVDIAVSTINNPGFTTIHEAVHDFILFKKQFENATDEIQLSILLLASLARSLSYKQMKELQMHYFHEFGSDPKHFTYANFFRIAISNFCGDLTSDNYGFFDSITSNHVDHVDHVDHRHHRHHRVIVCFNCSQKGHRWADCPQPLSKTFEMKIKNKNYKNSGW